MLFYIPTAVKACSISHW